MPTRYNHHTIPMEKVPEAQTKSFLAKSRNQNEDRCHNLPEVVNCIQQTYKITFKVLPAEKKRKSFKMESSV